MARKRVLVVINVMHAGGGATLNVWSLARNIALHTDWEAVLLTAPKTGAPPLALDPPPGLEVRMLRTWRNPLVDRVVDCWPLDFRETFAEVARMVDFVHFHSIWRYPTRRGCPMLRNQSMPYVISPRGTLDPWAIRYRGVRKRLAMALHERRNLEQAACLHATATAELEHFRALGFTGPVAVVPNGLAQEAIEAFEAGPQPRPADAPLRLLFVSRLHPKKRVKELVEAWTVLATEFPGWRLDIVGTGAATYEKACRDALQGSAAAERTQFHGHLSGPKLWRQYQSADLFVLPTHTENFGSVVIEALAAGLPVITTTGTPWAELETRGCGWWKDLEREPLSEVLRQALRLSDAERREMGVRGRAWVPEAFAWPAIARKITGVYDWILAGADRAEAPECVDFPKEA